MCPISWGALRRLLQVVLLDQPSIRDPKLTVANVIAAANKALGANVTVTRFARLKVGETTVM